MIDTEMNSILQAVQSYVRTYLEEDDLDDEMISALQKAANTLSYRKKYYNVMKDEIVYLPTCSKLILSNDLMEEAEKYYYDDSDEFIPEYCKAVRSVVFDAIMKKDKSKLPNRDDDPDSTITEDDEENDNDELMAKLATEWTEAFEDDESTEVVDAHK
jgi:hypothetical protein